MRIASSLVALLTVLSLPVLIGGCPPPGKGRNTAPVANAGPNQSVAPGTSVALNGAGSTDADGDTLTFAWTQTAGTAVTLNGADTASPTFTAPNTAQTLTFQLTVSDGRAFDSDSVEISVNAAVKTTPVLLVANFGGNNITAYEVSNVNNVNGNVPPSANLAGALTQLASPTDVVIGADGSMLVINGAVSANSITTYLDARDLAAINGNIVPARNVQGAATALAAPASMALGNISDLLFVSDLAPARILVFSGATTPSFNGNLAPTRTFTSVDMTSPIGINFGANDTLYVANSGAARNVAVFDNASNLSGAAAATRIITSPAFGGLSDVFVDTATNRMFVVDSATRGIHVFSNASTLNGNIQPDSTLTVFGAINLTAVAVDSNGVGYIVDSTNNAVYSYDNIATRNGTFAPDRTLKGSATQLLRPIRVFLLE